MSCCVCTYREKGRITCLTYYIYAYYYINNNHAITYNFIGLEPGGNNKHISVVGTLNIIVYVYGVCTVISVAFTNCEVTFIY